jgi:AraC-like DNA-binding protein/mannose-6-phosphate isomerase-like protein (cupin superfamily)
MKTTRYKIDFFFWGTIGMIIAMCSLEIASNGMERQPAHTFSLPCYAYCGNIHDYIASKIPPHWHHEFEVMILDSGSVLISLADSEFQLQSGEGYFISSDKLHSISCVGKEPCNYRSLVFDYSIISGAVDSAFDTRYIRPLLEHGPFALMLQRTENWQQPIFSAFEEVFSACAEEPFGYEFAIRHALSKIVLTLIEHNSKQRPLTRPASQNEERLKQIIAWMDAQYTQPITLHSLADAAHISPRECERIFKQLLHVSPMTYLLQRRITAASKLLVCTDIPITEVGLCCGFSNHSYFTKQFRALTGYTPRNYRTYIRISSS